MCYRYKKNSQFNAPVVFTLKEKTQTFIAKLESAKIRSARHVVIEYKIILIFRMHVTNKSILV